LRRSQEKSGFKILPLGKWLDMLPVFNNEMIHQQAIAGDCTRMSPSSGSWHASAFVAT